MSTKHREDIDFIDIDGLKVERQGINVCKVSLMINVLQLSFVIIFAFLCLFDSISE